MFVLKNKQATFAKKEEPIKEDKQLTGNQVATLTISIPYNRRFIRDRKGRKRRLTTKFTLPLVGGQGAMTSRTLRTQLTKDLANGSNKVPINTKTYRKILSIFNNK